MFKLHRILLAGALLAMASTTSQAGNLIAGSSLAAGGGQVVGVPSDLMTSPIKLTTDKYTVNNGATNSFSGTVGWTTGQVIVDTSAPSSLTLTFTNGSGDTLTFASNGAGVLSGPSVVLGSKFLGVTYLGTVTLTSGNNAPLTGDGQLSLTYTQTGSGQIGGGLSLLVTPIPEPSSVALAGIGMAAAGLFGLRKRYAK